jgi:molybdate/tungstate transport system permease protein
MAFVSLPFLVNAARDGFVSVNPRLERVARTLGATPWQTFFKVSLPLSWRSILSGSIMMWARGISEFGAVIVLAYHPMTAPVLIWERFESYGLKYARPVAVILILLCLIIFAVLRSLAARREER